MVQGPTRMHKKREEIVHFGLDAVSGAKVSYLSFVLQENFEGRVEGQCR